MKASEVFDLPVSVGKYNMNNDNIYSASGVWCATLFSDKEAKVAANCINHADALADALTSVLEAYFSKSGVTTDVAASAVDILKAYAGAGK